MSVDFNVIPQNLKQPLYWVEVDGSMAGNPVSRVPCLLLGTMLSTGTGEANVPVAVGSLEQLRDLAGLGSMLDNMGEAFFANNFAHELWVLPVEEPGAGVAAEGSITVTQAASSDGVLYLYVAGRRVPVGVSADDDTAEIAAKIVDAINDNPHMPVVAVLSATGSSQVDLTCRWKGIDGNGIDIRHNYRGAMQGESMPPGLAVTIVAMSGGAGAPDLSAAMAALGDEPYEFVALPYTDGASILTVEAEFGFGENGRWGWRRQLFGQVYSAKKGSYATQMSYGPTNNYPVISIMDLEANVPSCPWEAAAAYAAKAGRAFLNSPSRPLHTLTLTGILPAPPHQRRNVAERSALAGVGLATQFATTSGEMQISRETTTYQRNKYNQGDDAYELMTTLATLSELLRRQRHRITTKYPRHKLANDGTRFGVGQAVVTPKVIKGELIAQYSLDEADGLVEDARSFAENLVVERDPNNPNRVNVIYPPDLVNQLRIFAVVGQFRLQYARGVDREVI